MDRRRLRVMLLMATGLAAAVVAGGLSWSGALDRLENATVDTRFRVRGEQPPDPGVVVVGIDDATLDAIDFQFPYPRSIVADAIDALTAAGAATVAVDLTFAEHTTPFDDSAQAQAAATAEDARLVESIARSKRVVLAVNEFSPSGEPSLFPELAAITPPVGNTSWSVDDRFRRLTFASADVPSLPVAIVAHATGRPVARSGFTGGEAFVDYRGGPDSVRPIPFVDIATGSFDRAAVRGKIVVLGATAPRLGDRHPTPFGGGLMSGPQINAAAVSTLLRGVPLRRAPAWLTVLVTLALVTATVLLHVWRRPLLGFAIGLVAVAVVAGIVQVAFNAGHVMNLTAPVTAGVLAGVGGLAVNSATVLRERRRLRTAFARFLPESVIERMVETAESSAGLPGTRIYATVLFADLRGFTAAAERLPPESVIELLNRYLTEVGDAVLDSGGTLVSYQGDGIMAVFGAPIELPDHADRAVIAAREIRDVRLPAFNAWAATHGVGQAFRVGIGVASGPVMSGTVGSERRLEYATVGDTTNGAARLQAMTKESERTILIADATRAALTAPVPDLVAVGALDVRGREVPTAVWTLAEPA